MGWLGSAPEGRWGSMQKGKAKHAPHHKHDIKKKGFVRKQREDLLRGHTDRQKLKGFSEQRIMRLLGAAGHACKKGKGE